MLYGYDAGVLGGIQNEPSFRNAIGVSAALSCVDALANEIRIQPVLKQFQLLPRFTIWPLSPLQYLPHFLA